MQQFLFSREAINNHFPSLQLRHNASRRPAESFLSIGCQLGQLVVSCSQLPFNHSQRVHTPAESQASALRSAQALPMHVLADKLEATSRKRWQPDMTVCCQKLEVCSAILLRVLQGLLLGAVVGHNCWRWDRLKSGAFSSRQRGGRAGLARGPVYL